jgi:pyruvate formate lyase activating enzyme
MTDVAPTPAATLTRARRIALAHGLHYVYTGNVHDTEGGTTSCPHCGTQLIVRDWYNILDYRVSADGHCNKCGGAIAGRYQRFDQAFGSRRVPVRLSATVP